VIGQSGAAPTVEPAPIFAASIDTKISPEPSDRPATKKSLLSRTKRDANNPSAITPTE
jgi:hypothetical protein